MFPAWHIALTALVTAVVVSGSIFLSHRSQGFTVDLLLTGGAAGLGVLLWRLGANTPTLNADPLPGVSPADVLSAPMAYVAVGIVAGLRGKAASEPLSMAPALAALVALLVTIITI
jgi:hypothetical protein